MILLLLGWLIVAIQAVEHVHFVDKQGQNMLFRGGSPEASNGTFDYAGLVQSIGAAAKASGHVLPNHFSLHVINVENLDSRWHHKDGFNVVAEYTFFKSNPSKGNFTFWYTRGTMSNPRETVLSSSLPWLAQKFPEWGPDHLASRVPQLRKWMLTPTNVPTLFYLHCDCGCDRTGEHMGSYAMQYLGYSWDRACKWNNDIAGRPQMEPYQHAMAWYCVFLKHELNITTVGDCLNFHLYTPQTCESDN